ncbi:MAG: hypothetical protein QGG40_07125 [Myxococcota bacterium]|nr:hypothetical protein [Myxococcota bacterium]
MRSTLLVLTVGWLGSTLALAQEVEPESGEGEVYGADVQEQEAADSAIVHTTRVLVAPLEPGEREATGLAALLTGYLHTEVGRQDGLESVELDDVGPVENRPVRDYLEDCPWGERVECAYRAGAVAGADLAVSGTVRLNAVGTEVGLHVIDVHAGRDSVSFRVDVEVGQDAVLAEMVARLLQSMAAQRPADSGDKIFIEGSDLTEELEALEAEVGEVTELETRGQLELDLERYTEQDLSERAEVEGSKPWERLEMTPSAYVRYRNSGLALHEWRDRARGRQGQLLIRPSLGWVRAPISAVFEGGYALEGENLDLVETYAFEAVETGGGGWAGGTLAFGLTPQVEIGLTAGTASARYEVTIQEEEVGEPVTPAGGMSFANRVLVVGPQVLVAPLPAASVRPVVGGRVTYWKGSGLQDHLVQPEYLVALAVPWLLVTEAVVGVETRVNPFLDLVLQVPVGVVVGGETSYDFHEGSGHLTEVTTAPDPGMTTAGLMLGLQTRIGGGDSLAAEPDFIDDPVD